MNNKCKLLLWGSKFQAKLIYSYLGQHYGITPLIIYDENVDKPIFEHEAQFINDFISLQNKINSLSHFIIGVGSDYGYQRNMIGNKLEKLGLKPFSLIHPNSFISKKSEIGKGIITMPNATVNDFTTINDYVILNTNCTIDHETSIGNGVHVMGGASLAGNVSVGEYSTIGTNSTIIPFIKIGINSYVGAGSVIIRDVPNNVIVAGNPAKLIKTKPSLI